MFTISDRFAHNMETYDEKLQKRFTKVTPLEDNKLPHFYWSYRDLDEMIKLEKALDRVPCIIRIQLYIKSKAKVNIINGANHL